jgi:hypothetical protein
MAEFGDTEQRRSNLLGLALHATDVCGHGGRHQRAGAPIDLLAALVLVEGGSRMVVGLTGQRHRLRLLGLGHLFLRGWLLL